MNRLKNAASPYLRQHADNPVDWHEWAPEPFTRAREEDKPVFLSVGYSSCHWCHVMAHESFEDEEVARLLNENFVSIKVDREERPDIDSVYMVAVQALTGRGGWPMSVFLTPEGEPFFGGTYWPREDRQGMPGFIRVLESVAAVWRDQRDQVDAAGARLVERLREIAAGPRQRAGVDHELAARAAQVTVSEWDRLHGGFGKAPKFPQAMVIEFLLAYAQRTGDAETLQAATHSLARMSQGGIYDHVGGGFARYSVDATWLVPHFEKMLYDNALLLRAYTYGAQLTGSERFRRVVDETATYLINDMQDPRGGFYSATDADSEGQEGKYFVWSLAEFREVVEQAGVDPDEWAERFGVTERGNFSDPHGHAPANTSILHETEPMEEAGPAVLAERERVRAALAERRTQRVPPELDDKVLTSWSALALGALAEAGAVFGKPEWVAAARGCAQFLADNLVADGDRLLHRWTAEHGAGIPAFAEDIAYLAQALLILFEADPDPRWFEWARTLAATADERFRDPDTGTYYSTAADSEQLVTRPRELLDNATPAPTSVMADVHLRLTALTADPDHTERAVQALEHMAPVIARAPSACGQLLRATERLLGDAREVAIVGDAGEARSELEDVYHEQWRPADVLAVGEPADDHVVPLLRQRDMVDGQPTAYVCQHFVCQRPVTDADEFRALLGEEAAAAADRGAGKGMGEQAAAAADRGWGDDG